MSELREVFRANVHTFKVKNYCVVQFVTFQLIVELVIYFKFTLLYVSEY